MERRCEYRNCCANIEKKRPNAKYCSRSCKTNERKYNKREDNKLKEEKQNIANMIDTLKSNTINDEVIKLFNLINGKK